MTDVSVRLGDVPVLVVDGEPVAPESLVTIPAQTIARLAAEFAAYGRSQGVTPSATNERPRIGFRPPQGEPQP
jgi:hypothetical protein